MKHSKKKSRGKTAKENKTVMVPDEETVEKTPDEASADGQADTASEGSAGSAAEASAEEVEKVEEVEPSEVSEEREETFDEFIENLTPDGIGGESAAPKKKKSGALSLVLYVVFIGVFIVSIFMLGQNIYAKYRGGQIYGEIADIFENGAEGDGHGSAFTVPSAASTLFENLSKGGSSGVSGSGELSRVRASLASLSKVNPDTYGWIVVEGTTVNYPVVHGTDNDYYLDHAYTGDYLPVGAIFADFRTKDSVTDNINLVIYGHNVADGSMFGCLSDYYADQEFFDNSKIYLYTMDGIYTFKPVSVHEPAIETNFIRTEFRTDADIMSFFNWIVNDSVFKVKGVELDADSTVLTLSTCTGRGHAERFVVHAVLVDSVTD